MYLCVYVCMYFLKYGFIACSITAVILQATYIIDGYLFTLAIHCCCSELSYQKGYH